jgi:MoaA/NifB/PqqE/SkfB family radical SAM enzyme
MRAGNLEAHAIADTAATAHVIRELPVVVLMPHSRCNCRCVMCDIWKIRQIREVTARDLEPHLASLRELRVRWVVFSGGEPLMHSDLWALARLLRREGIRTTLLTAGLTLERHAAAVAENLDDVIISIDGPREIHDRIRGAPDAYQRLERGVQALREHRPSIQIHGRCTIQSRNFRHIRETVNAARKLKLNSVSFLAADMASEAFNHSAPLPASAAANIALNADEVEELAGEIEGMIEECREGIAAEFIREKPEKLRRIVRHFRAHLGQVTPVAPRCNAPWVSAVVEADGAVRPCFFHRPIGNIQGGTLIEVLNSDEAVRFRSQLDTSTDAICQRCVCSLFLEQGQANLLQSGGDSTRRNPSPHPGANGKTVREDMGN